MGLDKGLDDEHYGASIPLSVAMDPANVSGKPRVLLTLFFFSVPPSSHHALNINHSQDVLLVWNMNGETLSADHGFPLRVVVPGAIGARSVKWVGRIVVARGEYQGFWQQKDYKMFSPSIEAGEANYDREGECVAQPLRLLCDSRRMDGVPQGWGRVTLICSA